MNDVTDRALERTSLHRSFDVGDGFEFRDDGENGITFEGVASVVDTPYTVRDQFGEFTETIRAGAFNRTLKSKADVALFVNHDTRALPLATRSDGSLQLAADPHLRVVANLNGLRPSVQEVRYAVTDGQARQMSIGFNVPKDPKKDVWNDDYTERVIHEVNVLETSIVWKGASPTTTGKMRSLDELLELDMTAWSEDEVRRAIAHLETRLPSVEDEAAVKALAEVAAQIAERDRADRERLERLRLIRP
jgi:HK97 family phage prohead protease